MIPAFVVFTFTLSYALVRPSIWQAALTLLVDEDQNTVLEIIKNRNVVENALITIGSSTEELEKIREDISLDPPNGEEFGSTKIVYLKVRNEDRDKAIKLTDALFNQFSRQFYDIRNKRVKQSIAELSQIIDSTNRDLNNTTTQIKETPIDIDPNQIRKLQEDLIVAKTNTSTLMGIMTNSHPKVIAALNTETNIVNELDQLKIQIVNGIAYQNLLNEVELKREILKNAYLKLAKENDNLIAENSICRLGEPETGLSPVGPNKVVITLAGFFGGIIVGIGIVFLTVGENCQKLTR